MFGSWKKLMEPVRTPYGPSHNPFDHDETEDLPGIMITGPWDRRMVGYMAARDIRALYLNPARGFKCNDYGFLSSLPQLELLSLSTPSPVSYDGPIPIGSLTRLKRLSAAFAFKRPTDLTQLPHLQSCSLEWSGQIESLFDCMSLKRLNLYGTKHNITPNLARLTTLRKLKLARSSIRSLSRLRPLGGLEMLDLEICRNLESLDGIETFAGLKCLVLNEAHQISSLERLTALKHLEALIIRDCGEIDTLAPLAELGNLKAVSFSGAKTKIADGNLVPLTTLPKLSMLMFAPRRHYSHKLVKKWDWNNFDHPDLLLAPK